MSKEEMNAYRFGRGEDPTDEMLEQIMKEVAEEVRESNKKATEVYFAQMHRNIVSKHKKWADRLNRVINGRIYS